MAMENEKTAWKKDMRPVEERYAKFKENMEARFREAHKKKEAFYQIDPKYIVAPVAAVANSKGARNPFAKENAAAQKHLASVRIKELEERNEQQTEELTDIQHAIQELRDTANKKGTRQALELLDAQEQQEKLCKTIHEKDLVIMETKEKQQELLEKYNAALGCNGEIIGKALKTHERMKEISAEFDVYMAFAPSSKPLTPSMEMKPTSCTPRLFSSSKICIQPCLLSVSPIQSPRMSLCPFRPSPSMTYTAHSSIPHSLRIDT